MKHMRSGRKRSVKRWLGLVHSSCALSYTPTHTVCTQYTSAALYIPPPYSLFSC